MSDDDDYDAGEECGRWNNGRLGSYYDCSMAGTEFCDWECPYGYAARLAEKGEKAVSDRFTDT